MKRIRRAGVMASTMLLAGCGALFNSGLQTVQFTSSPDQAEVWVDGIPRGRTPLTLGLAKNQSHTVLFKLPGYSDFGTVIHRQVSAKYIVLDVLGGVIPVVIDAVTGSWYKLSDNTVHGALTKDGEPDGTLTPEQLTLVKLGIPVDRAIELTETGR